MKQDTFTIEGLKGVGKVELSFNPDSRVRVLFGSNGVGKTKCLEALFGGICLAHPLLGENLITFADNIRISSEMMRVVGASIKEQEDGTFAVRLNDGTAICFLGASNRANIIPVKTNKLIGTYEERRDNYINKIQYALANGMLSSLGMNEPLNEWFMLRANSSSKFQAVEDDRSCEIDTVMELLSALDSRINPDSKSLKIDGAGKVFFTVEGAKRELSELSSGFISLVKIIQGIVSSYGAFTNEINLRNVRGFVFIDEIESHLHAEWQAKIVPLLKELFPNTIFYIATHSPIVLSQLHQGEAYLLKREEDGVVRSHQIVNPSGKIISDLIQESFGIDLNKLKSENSDPVAQAEAKRLFLELLDETEAANG